MPRIVLVDDHHVVRQGLRALLERDPNLTIVGEAAEGHEAVELVERLKPDVLLLDLMIPGLNGLEVTRLVKRRRPETRVIILSMYSNEAYVLQALRNGATGYVLKDSGVEELLEAVRATIAGRRYLCRKLSHIVGDSYNGKTRARPLDPYETLTSREREVLQLAAEGKTSAGIAACLRISPRTAESHRANLMRKLGLRTQSDLIRYALNRGLIPLEESWPTGQDKSED